MKIDETLSFEPKFDESGLIPAIAQDYKTNEILMLAYMNKESLDITLSSGEAVYWSRSRNKLWKKGETSGHIQKIHEILVDCDQDALILKIEQMGGKSCHTGRRSCFYRALEIAKNRLKFYQ
ncbi:MAG: phosphoribosyl-AMP cyclohydrolase [Micavibrio aeruginosavorus]|uniref:Phosphoribosyl-AMP cyclohydrolase n=1 Tax=Micavibrio aeruginosavorus TaxID=349221 RepID=A0A2W5FN81_9BACT|nr:MAG: phosphoribosyl-AMP cyclohydrolase [Micavibrio aeruginosavorus]